MGFEKFFDKSFAPHVDLDAIPPEERAHYIADWSKPGALTAMLNWYRASQMVVPAPGEAADMPAGCRAAFPKIRDSGAGRVGDEGQALLPLQLDGLGERSATI